MTDDLARVSIEGLRRLQSAAEDFARPEIIRIAGDVIEELRSRSAIGIFEQIAARHMWDEYCWIQQEGPFDDEEELCGVRIGSLSGNWDETVRAFVSGEVEKLPEYALIFLSAHVFSEDLDNDENEFLGDVYVDGIVNIVVEEINERASRRKLGLIGPNRADVIGHEIEGSGMVWSALSGRNEAMDVISSHVGALIDPDADLSALAAELVAAFIDAANEEAEDTFLAEFIAHFDNDIRSLLLEKDVLPTLEDMRAALIEQLDG
jgi:hypothetical protein